MTALHYIGMIAAAVLVAATSAGSHNLRRRGADLPLLGHLIGWPLMIGNSASLLPAAPTWYRVVMIVFTVAGLAWYLVTVAAGDPRRLDDDATIASRDIYAGRIPTRPRPDLRVVRGGLAEEPSGRITHPSLIDEPVLDYADQATFATAGRPGSHFATGSTTVASNLGAFVDTNRTRRAHGRHVARTHSGVDPTVRFLRLAEENPTVRGPRDLGRAHRA